MKIVLKNSSLVFQTQNVLEEVQLACAFENTTIAHNAGLNFAVNDKYISTTDVLRNVTAVSSGGISTYNEITPETDKVYVNTSTVEKLLYEDSEWKLYGTYQLTPAATIQADGYDAHRGEIYFSQTNGMTVIPAYENANNNRRMYTSDKVCDSARFVLEGVTYKYVDGNLVAV